MSEREAPAGPPGSRALATRIAARLYGVVPALRWIRSDEVDAFVASFGSGGGAPGGLPDKVIKVDRPGKGVVAQETQLLPYFRDVGIDVATNAPAPWAEPAGHHTSRRPHAAYKTESRPKDKLPPHRPPSTQLLKRTYYSPPAGKPEVPENHHTVTIELSNQDLQRMNNDHPPTPPDHHTLGVCSLTRPTRPASPRPAWPAWCRCSRSSSGRCPRARPTTRRARHCSAPS